MSSSTENSGTTADDISSNAIDWNRSDTAYYDKQFWLTKEMEKELEGLRPKPEHINSTGAVDKDALHDAASKFFYIHRKFCNFAQFHQAVAAFSSPWGFDVSREGMQLKCKCAKPHKKPKVSMVSPSKQRERMTSLKIIECPFKLNVSSTKTEKSIRKGNAPPRFCVPVKISSHELKHTCTPSKEQQILVRKAGGDYVMAEKVAEIAETLQLGQISTTALRAMLKEHLPDDVALTSTDIHNFRVRCKIFLRTAHDRASRKSQAERMMKFKGLDRAEHEIIAKDDQLSASVLEVLKDSLHDANNSFAAITFLTNLRNAIDGFDYRVARNSKGQVTGLAWMSVAMRKNWIRYGHFLSLDAQKRQMNNLHWPYIAPMTVDCENKNAVVIESLVEGETNGAYAWVVQSLFSMEPLRSPDSVRIVFSDCFLSPSAILQFGMNNAHLVWDQYHLLNEVWPKELGLTLAPLASKHLSDMVNASSQEACDAAFSEIENNVLSAYPAKLEYVRSFYEQYSQHCVRFKIEQLEGNLGRVGSAPSEQNHSSIVAHFGVGGASMEPHQQIAGLIVRHGNIVVKKARERSKYRFHCRTQSNGSNKALEVLSKYAYETYWKPFSHTAKKLTVVQLNGQHVISKLDSGEQVSVIPVGQRCDCIRRKSYLAQCPCEIAISGGVFDENKFDKRHWQDHLISFSNEILQRGGNDIDADGGIGNAAADIVKEISVEDLANADDFNGFGESSGEPDFPMDDNLPGDQDDIFGEEDDDDSIDAMLDTTQNELTQEASQTQLSQEESVQDTLSFTATSGRRSTKIDYSKIMHYAGELAKSVGSNQNLGTMVTGCLIELTRIVNGNPTEWRSCNFTDIIASAEQAYRSTPQFSYGSSLQQGQLKPAPAAAASIGPVIQKRKQSFVEKAFKKARKRKSECSFCGDNSTHQRISSCPRVQEFGMLLSKSAVNTFSRQISGQGDLYPIQQLPVGCGELMQELPENQMKWLVIHGRCLVDPSGGTTLSNLCAIVTVLGKGGLALNVNYIKRPVILGKVLVWVEKTKEPRTILGHSLTGSTPMMGAAKANAAQTAVI